MISSTRATKKIQLKVDCGGKLVWTHFCYVNPEILDVFLDVTKTRRTQMSSWLTKWAEEDFNWVIDFTEYNHIKLVKELIIDKYRKVYPHLYYNNSVDTHGWIRCWVSEKMGKEIRRYDKPAYNRLFNSSTNYGSRF